MFRSDLVTVVNHRAKRTGVKSSCLFVLLVLFLFASSMDAKAWVTGWTYRKQMTINGDHVDSALTNFPVLVSLSSDSDVSAGAQADGDDIYFALADDTKLDHEIESYSSGTLTAWVEIPNVNGTTDTYFYMYYGNGDATDQSNATGVWDSNYVAVYHLNESPNDNTDGYNDSTSNNYDGDSSGRASNPSATYISNGQEFEATSADSIDLDATLDSSLSVNALTYSAWIYTDNTSGSRGVMEVACDGNSGSFLYRASAQMKCYHKNGGWKIATGGTNISAATWTYISCNWNDTDDKLILYNNGSNDAEVASVTTHDWDSADPHTIGDYAGTAWDGRIDEVRISNVDRSAAWVKADYHSGYGDLITVGAEESNDVANPTVSALIPVDGATDVASTGNLIITFDEAVDVETGNITIKKTSDNSVFETIDVTGGKVTGTGTTTITVNPANGMAFNTGYYVQIDATAFDDAAGNSYNGIASTTEWNFTTEAEADTTNPLVSTFDPPSGSIGVDVEKNLTITFDEAVDVESGNITLKLSSNDSTVEAIDVTSGQVTGTGTTTIVINPTANLSTDTDYYVQIDATAFDDPSSNSYAGIANDYTWIFSTRKTGAMGASPIDAWEFQTDTGLNENMVTVDSANGIAAVVVRGSGEDGWVYSFSVDNGGDLTGSALDSLEFNTLYADETMITHVNGDLYAVVYRGSDGDGFMNTFNIEKNGDISDAVLDTWEYDTDDGWDPGLIKISNSIIAIAYRCTTSTVCLSTVTLAQNGDITKSFTDSITLHATDFNEYRADIAHAINDYYAVVFEENTGAEAYIKTVKIESNGSITAASSLEFSTTAKYPAVAKSQNGIIAVAYSDSGTNDGFIETFQIDGSNGAITDLGQSLEFDTSFAEYMEMVPLSDNDTSVLIVAKGPSSYSVAYTVFIEDGTGDIGGAVVDTMNIQTTSTIFQGVTKVRGDIFAAAYSDGNNDGWIETFDVDCLPERVSVSPADNSVEVEKDVNLTIKFDHNVDIQGGNFYIKKASNGATLFTIDADGAQVTGNGTEMLTINPPSDLDGGTEYYVNYDGNLVQDDSTFSSYPLTDSTTWSFTTNGVPAGSSPAVPASRRSIMY